MIKFPARMKAGLIHLACSIAVASLALAVIFPVWHPGALAELQGVSRLVLILIVVDVTLGPLLTTIVFNPQKAPKLIRLDLTVIAVVQLSALVYGVATIFQARPVFVVYNVDRFTVVTAAEVDRDSLQIAQKAGFGPLGLLRPEWLAARLPDDPKGREEIMMSSLSGGADLAQLPEWYLPLEVERQSIIQHSRPLAELRKSNELDDMEWSRWLKSFKIPEDQLGYIPVVANSKDGSAIIRRADGKVLSLAPLLPNWLAKRSTAESNGSSNEEIETGT